jgi:hypothetical protein
MESEFLDNYMSGHDSPHKTREFSSYRRNSNATIPAAKEKLMISIMQSSACFFYALYKLMIQALPFFAKRSAVFLSTHEHPAALNQKPPEVAVACLSSGSTSDGVAA